MCLEVDKATDTAAIKKAHRKQSLRFHPDRALDQDEREEFVEKQSQLNDAMNVLLNPEKREVYDKAQFLTGMGEEAVRTFESHKQPEAYKNFDLSQKNIDPTKMVRHKEKADTKEMEVNLTFKQCMTGIFQKQEVDRRVRCSHCKGTGADKHEHHHTCKYCNGRGKWADIAEILPGITKEKNYVCDYCSGTGKHIDHDHTCDVCNGTGLEAKKDEILMIIKAGVFSGYKHTYEDMGDFDEIDHKLPSGDLQVTIQCPQEELFNGIVFSRQDQNIIARINITLVEALHGFNKSITLPDGHDVLVTKQGITQNNEEIQIAEAGFSTFEGRQIGNFIMIANVVITDEDRTSFM
ncbi:Chaperone_protein DnaJ [Hexamita inflata]|uniref:Chaperone protein DnaJ n=2 Tax=Hexamita inflata TaxID=28002 RepID=A0AA86TYT6_9EUKA|nr:Chaperone protein DnaJ [Hexamita inflata]